jgi:hypothetical protein
MPDPQSDDYDTAGGIPRSAPTRTLEKGLFLLGLFDVDHPEWTLKELRERAALPKATTRRLMKTLEAASWVAYDQDSGKYPRPGAPPFCYALRVGPHSAPVPPQAHRGDDRDHQPLRVDRSGSDDH